jgi:hypothetical protein
MKGIFFKVLVCAEAEGVDVPDDVGAHVVLDPALDKLVEALTAYETKQYKQGLEAIQPVLDYNPDHGESLCMRGRGRRRARRCGSPCRS